MINTKKRILEAAAKEFALKGYNGATVRDICNSAGVNIASVNYHFKSKEALYEEMFAFLFCETEKENFLEKKWDGTLSQWREMLRKWIESIILDIIKKNPLNEAKWKIFGWEIQEPSTIFKNIYENFLKPRLSTLALHFRKVLPLETSDDEVYLRVFSVVAMCVFYFRDRELINLVFPQRDFISEKMEQIIENITNSACIGISLKDKESIKA